MTTIAMTAQHSLIFGCFLKISAKFRIQAFKKSFYFKVFKISTYKYVSNMLKQYLFSYKYNIDQYIILGETVSL